MINYIWGVFILLGVIISIIKGDNNLTNNLITSGTKGIDIIINLVSHYGYLFKMLKRHGNRCRCEQGRQHD